MPASPAASTSLIASRRSWRYGPWSSPTQFLKRGIPVSVNTDDPAMFGNSLAEEYEALAREQDFTRDEIRALILSGISTSWMSDEDKTRMTREFETDPEWNTD
jgi:hypothetical protein